MISTYCAFHLGDNLVHLNFMRRLALKYPDLQFGHCANTQHQVQLAPLYAGVKNLKQLFECPDDAINAWRGDQNYWHMHSQRNDFTRFHFDWFAYLANKMGLESPIKTREDMMFDYPALAPIGSPTKLFDYLIINSVPHSAQFQGFNSHEFARMVQTLLDRGKTVVTTFPTGTMAECTHDGSSGLSVTAIGKLSQSCGMIVGVATGPIWTCFNKWNADKQFVLMLDHEFVKIMNNVAHVKSYTEAIDYL